MIATCRQRCGWLPDILTYFHYSCAFHIVCIKLSFNLLGIHYIYRTISCMTGCFHTTACRWETCQSNYSIRMIVRWETVSLIIVITCMIVQLWLLFCCGVETASHTGHCLLNLGKSKLNYVQSIWQYELYLWALVNPRSSVLQISVLFC